MAKKSVKIIIYILFVLCVVALAALPKLLQMAEDKKPAGKGAKDQAILAEAIVIKADTLVKSFLTTGSLVADEYVSLKPEVPGKIVGIYFREGQRVGAGTMLAKLNDADLQAQLKKAEQKLDLLMKIGERQKILLQNNNISLEEFEKASSEAEIQETEIEYIKAQIAKTEIIAPFGGITGLRKLSKGAFVNISDIITTLQKTDYIKIDFSIPQKYSKSVAPGTKIVFYMPPGRRKFEAEIYASEPNIDEYSRSLKQRAKIRNNKNILMPGTFVEVEIMLEESAKSLVIPSQALVPEMNSEKVYLYKNGIAKQASVKIGLRDENTVEIIEGLSIGDTVITTGIIQMKPGNKIKLISVK